MSSAAAPKATSGSAPLSAGASTGRQPHQPVSSRQTKLDSPTYLQPTVSSRSRILRDDGTDGTQARGTGVFQRMNSSRRHFRSSSSISSLSHHHNWASGSDQINGSRADGDGSVTDSHALVSSSRASLPPRRHSLMSTSSDGDGNTSAALLHSRRKDSTCSRDAVEDCARGAKERRQSANGGNLPPLPPSSSPPRAASPPAAAGRRQSKSGAMQEAKDEPWTGDATPLPSTMTARKQQRGVKREGRKSLPHDEEAALAGEQVEALRKSEREEAITASLLRSFAGSSVSGLNRSSVLPSADVSFAQEDVAPSASASPGKTPREGTPSHSFTAAGKRSGGDNSVAFRVEELTPAVVGSDRPTQSGRTPRTVRGTPQRSKSNGSGANPCDSAVPRRLPSADVSTASLTSKLWEGDGRGNSSVSHVTPPPDRDVAPHRDDPFTGGLENTASPSPTITTITIPSPHEATARRRSTHVVEKAAPMMAQSRTPRGGEKRRPPAIPRARSCNQEAAAAVAAAAAVTSKSSTTGGALPEEETMSPSRAVATDRHTTGDSTSRRATPLKQNPLVTTTRTTDRASNFTRHREAQGGSAPSALSNSQSTSLARSEHTVSTSAPPAVQVRNSQGLQPAKSLFGSGRPREPKGGGEEGVMRDSIAVGHDAVGRTLSAHRVEGTPRSCRTDNGSRATSGVSDNPSPAPMRPWRASEDATGEKGNVVALDMSERSCSSGSYEDMESGAADVVLETAPSFAKSTATDASNSSEQAVVGLVSILSSANTDFSMTGRDTSRDFADASTELSPTAPDGEDEEFSHLLEETVRQGGLSDLTGHSPLSPKQRLQIQTGQRLERESRRRRKNPSQHRLRPTPELRRGSPSRSRCTSQRSAMGSTPSASQADASASAAQSPAVAASGAGRGVCLGADAVTTKPTRGGTTSRSRSQVKGRESPASVSQAVARVSLAGRDPSSSGDWITTEEKIVGPDPLMPPARREDSRSSEAAAAAPPVVLRTSASVLVQTTKRGDGQGNRVKQPQRADSSGKQRERERESTARSASSSQPPTPLADPTRASPPASVSASQQRPIKADEGSGSIEASQAKTPAAAPGATPRAALQPQTPRSAARRPSLSTAGAAGGGPAPPSLPRTPVTTRVSLGKAPPPVSPQPSSLPAGAPAAAHKRPPHAVAQAGKATSKTEPAAAPAPHVKQVLIPLLASPAEKERTVTVVFDLDETLCNNHVMGPALLRPGAVQILKHLRGLYPRPVYKPQTAKSGVAATAARLYGDAFKYSGIVAKPAQTTSSAIAAADDPSYEGLRLELVLWTASVERYARPVVARLDPHNDIFDQLIFRDIRWYSNMDYTKELARLGRSMERCVIVENAPASVYMNRHNAILVHDFVRNHQDRELYVVQALLTEWMARAHRCVLAAAKERAAADKRPQRPSASSCTPVDKVGGAAVGAAGSNGTRPAPDERDDGPSPPPRSGAADASHVAPQAKREGLTRQQSVHERLSSPRNLVKRSHRPVAGAIASQLPMLSEPTPPRHPAGVAEFLSNHEYVAPGTNYIKLTAVARVLRKLRAEKAAADEEDDPNGAHSDHQSRFVESRTAPHRQASPPQRATAPSPAVPAPAAAATTSPATPPNAAQRKTVSAPMASCPSPKTTTAAPPAEHQPPPRHPTAAQCPDGAAVEAADTPSARAMPTGDDKRRTGPTSSTGAEGAPAT